MADLLKKPLKGVIPPLITPLKDEYNIDYPGLERLIEHVLTGGVQGLFLLGSTGEGPSLSFELKREMIKSSCRLIAMRVPVLVGITDASLAESVKLAEYAAEHEASAVVLAPPFYFPAGQPEFLEYLEHLAPKLPLPLFLYNMPSMTKINIEVDTLRRASDINGIIGLKDSSGNMIRFHEYMIAMRDKPDFTLLMGAEELMAEAVIYGGHGGVTGGANIHPRLFVDLYEAAANKDMKKILKLQRNIFELRRIYSCGKFTSSSIKGIKCALSCMDICNDFVADPFHSFRAPERLQVERMLREIKLI